MASLNTQRQHLTPAHRNSPSTSSDVSLSLEPGYFSSCLMQSSRPPTHPFIESPNPYRTKMVNIFASPVKTPALLCPFSGSISFLLFIFITGLHKALLSLLEESLSPFQLFLVSHDPRSMASIGPMFIKALKTPSPTCGTPVCPCMSHPSGIVNAPF